MALLDYGETECPICGQVLQSGQRIVATSHFIGDETDPLWPFSDAAMHYKCFQTWPLRESFVNSFNSTVGQQVWANGTRDHMRADGVIESLPVDSSQFDTKT